MTNRESEILILAAEGKTDKEIAAELGIARGTVVTHWTRLRQRTGAINRTQAMAFEMARIYRETASELAQTASTYQSLVESLTDFAVFLMDKDGKITSWNPGVGKILGYGEEEWIGLYGDSIFTPEDRAKGVPEFEMNTALSDGRALDDRWHLRKDGSRFWASGVMVAVRGPEGQLLCLSKILRDLSRFKRLEERLSALGEDPTNV